MKQWGLGDHDTGKWRTGRKREPWKMTTNCEVIPWIFLDLCIFSAPNVSYFFNLVFFFCWRHSGRHLSLLCALLVHIYDSEYYWINIRAFPHTSPMCIHPPSCVISIRNGERWMLSNLFLLLTGVLMRVGESIHPVLEWLLRQPPAPVASIIAQLWINWTDAR